VGEISSPKGERVRTVYRRGNVRWLVLFTAFFLVLTSTLGGARTAMPIALVVSLGALEAALFILAIAAWRQAVITDAVGLTVRTLFGATSLPWPEVDRLVVRREGLIPGPIAYIRLRSGRSVRTGLWSGGLGVGNRATQRLIDALEADIADHLS